MKTNECYAIVGLDGDINIQNGGYTTYFEALHACNTLHIKGSIVKVTKLTPKYRLKIMLSDKDGTLSSPIHQEDSVSKSSLDFKASVICCTLQECNRVTAVSVIEELAEWDL